MASLIRYSRLISGRSLTKGVNKPSNPKNAGSGGAVRGGGGGGLYGVTVSTVAGGVSVTGGGFSIAGVTANIGDMLVVFISLNYTGTPNLTIDDGATGNVWTVRESASSGQAAQILIADCRVTVAYASANIEFSSSTGTYQVGKMYKIVPDGGTVSFVSKGTTQASAATTTHSASTVSVDNKQIIFGAASINTDDAVTEDSDTTNGSWSTNITIYADGGTEPNTGSLSAQWKVVNATGNQSWEVTTASNRVSARNYAIYQAA